MLTYRDRKHHGRVVGVGDGDQHLGNPELIGPGPGSPVQVDRGAPPPVISTSCQRICRQPVPMLFITASLPANRAA